MSKEKYIVLMQSGGLTATWNLDTDQVALNTIPCEGSKRSDYDAITVSLDEIIELTCRIDYELERLGRKPKD